MCFRLPTSPQDTCPSNTRAHLFALALWKAPLLSFPSRTNRQASFGDGDKPPVAGVPMSLRCNAVRYFQEGRESSVLLQLLLLLLLLVLMPLLLSSSLEVGLSAAAEKTIPFRQHPRSVSKQTPDSSAGDKPPDSRVASAITMGTGDKPPVSLFALGWLLVASQ